MPDTSYFTDLTYAYIGLLGAFSAAQVLLITRDNRVQIGLWLAASFFSALGTVNTPHLLNVADGADLSLYGVLAAQIGGFLRFFSLSYRKHSFNRNRLAETFFLMSAFAIPLLAVPLLGPYKLLIGSCIGASTSAACLFAALDNPALKFANKQPVALLVSGMAIGILALIYRASTAFPFTAEQLFIGSSDTQRTGMAGLILLSFVLQVGFTGVIAEQRQRLATRKEREAIRIRQRALRLQVRTVETARVARARLDLVQMLTHEVRQPISNAQASLQSINLMLRSANQIPENASFALNRAQSSLDDITLSLSNIIVASTIVSDERKWVRHDIDAYAALEMSILDFSPEQRSRLKIKPEGDKIFFDGVSILLRVALQNIIGQALRLSKPDTDIDIDLSVDDTHGMVVFDIGFMSASPEILTQNIFERRPSSDTERSNISSLGLFVVRQIAREFGGEAQLLSTAPGRLNFQLALAY
jgi:signal transduction histidine kinase